MTDTYPSTLSNAATCGLVLSKTRGMKIHEAAQIFVPKYKAPCPLRKSPMRSIPPARARLTNQQMVRITSETLRAVPHNRVTNQQMVRITSETTGAVPHNRVPSNARARRACTLAKGKCKRQSTRNTPTTAAATLPSGANTPIRGALDTPTIETLRTPTPAPGRAPSRQGSVAASAEAPPLVPASQDSLPRVGSPPPPPATTLPFSSMVVDAAEAVAHPATLPADAGPNATGKGKGKTKGKHPTPRIYQ
ncbi:hypothetical protein K438DRAFT_2169072 [Mycena galopus ATCC 62051]|nr:hypothetical protein K438DRAFT_2169072 [Mycena galopus ATCC 62051]